MARTPVMAEIRLDAVRRNLAAIRRRIRPGTSVCVAIKADAYGHGCREVLPAFIEAGVDRLAVADLHEALHLRGLGWTRPILCFGPALTAASERERASLARECVAAEVTCTISSLQEARILEAAAVRLHRRARVEIQVDSGMGRAGLLFEEAEPLLGEIALRPGLGIEGVFTHFSTADEPDLGFAREQLARFSALVNRLRGQDVPVRSYHAANSAAIFRLPESHFDAVRPGLAVYGYWGGPAEERPDDLVPAMRMVSRLAEVRRMPPGHPVGYGRTFITARPSRIGLVPIGYGDGYRRCLSNDAVMTLPAVRGEPVRTVPVVGRVSMDIVTIDLTDAGDAQVGDEVVIIDDDPAAPNSIEALARRLDAIPYELTCLLGRRIRHVAV